MSYMAVSSVEPEWMGRILDQCLIEHAGIEGVLLVHSVSSPPFWVVECDKGRTYHESDDYLGVDTVLNDHRAHLACGCSTSIRVEDLWQSRARAQAFYRDNWNLDLEMPPCCEDLPVAVVVEDLKRKGEAYVLACHALDCPWLGDRHLHEVTIDGTRRWVH